MHITEDHASIQKQVNYFYQIISGRAGEKRDWEKFKQLFIARAVLLPFTSSSDRNNELIGFDIESYIERLEKFLSTNDFYEEGYDYKIESTKNIASVVSRYEAKKTRDDSEIVKRGVNFIHLVKIKGIWKIESMIWEDE